MIEKDKTYTIIGSPENLSPEMILNKGYNNCANIWLIGVFTYFLHLGINPFYDKDPMIIYKNIIKVNYDLPNNIDRDIRLFIDNLIQKDITKRLGGVKGNLNDIVFHKWFLSFDWNSFMDRKMVPPFMPDPEM